MGSSGFLCLTFLLFLPAVFSGQPHCSWLPAPPSPTKLSLKCELRKLTVDFLNYTVPPPTSDQIKATSEVSLHCNAQLLFQSFFDSSLPIFRFQNLESLEIENCKIRKIEPLLLSKFGFLKRLVLHSHNGDWSGAVGLEVAQGGFDGLVGLKWLDLAHNNIWTFPENLFCGLGSLESLILSWNKLTQVSLTNQETEKCPLCESLVNLDLAENSIRTIGENSFGNLKNLKKLKLERNAIGQFESRALIGLNQLQLLNLSSNRIASLPQNLFQNNQLLQILDLGNNLIAELNGAEFSALENLRQLNLQSNRIRFISNQTFLYLPRLEILVLENNQLETIDAQLFVSQTQLRHLDLSRNRLTTLHSSLFQNLFELRQLYLDYNQLRRIEDPTFQSNLNLKDLGLAANLLSEVPRALNYASGLGALESLDLGENRITQVSNDSFKFQGHVYGLRLVGNRLTEIPVGFCSSLKKLHVLNLSQNRIQKISSSAFSGCPDLKALRLDRNDLEELPPLLAPQLPSLLWLNVSENRIRRANFYDFPTTTEWLDLSHNRVVFLGGVSTLVSLMNKGFKGPVQYNLRVLDISFNNLSHLDSSTILPKLETLRVNFNQLRSVASDTFGRALRLRRVELIGNQLNSLPLSSLRLPLDGQEGDFSADLSENRKTSADFSENQKISAESVGNRESSDFSENRKTSVESAGNRKTSVDFPGNRKTPVEILLGGNPFVCDCSMEWLTSTGLGPMYPRVVDLQQIKCRSVISGGTKELIALPDMNPTDFLCPYSAHCFALCQCCDFEACDCAQFCPDNCTCYHDASWTANIVQCSGLSQTTLPSRIPMDASQILLDGNNFRELGSHIFIGKKNVRVLFLNNSGLETIRNKTFNGLRALEVLRLDSNFLQVLNGHEFADLPNLEQLYLQNNLISSIAPNTFANLRALRILRIDGNRLTEFAIWDLSANFNLVQLRISQNPWSCSCQFLIPLRTWISSKKDKEDESVVMDYELASCQLIPPHPTPSSTPDGGSSRAPSDGGTWTLPLNSACSGHGEGDITTYSENGILEDENEKMAIHHSQHEISKSFKKFEISNLAAGENRPEADESAESGISGTAFWTFTFVVATILVVIFVIVVVTRIKIFEKLNFSFFGIVQNRSRVGSAEKVGEDSSQFLSDPEDTKLFDAYFLYNDSDEDLVTHKITPNLELSRLLLHYRDLCPGQLPGQFPGQGRSDLAWNPDMTLSAAEASRAIVIVLSKSFLEQELSNSVSRLAVQLVIHRFSSKVIFILIPPLDSTFTFPAFFPGLKLSRTTVLDFLDADFWPKLRLRLPGSDTAQAQRIQLQVPVYSQYHRNITPYQLQVPHAPTYQGTIDFSPSTPHPYYSASPEPTWRRPCPTKVEPTYNTSFAENFKFHQQQIQQSGTNPRNSRRNVVPTSSAPPENEPRRHYRPLIRAAPPQSRNQSHQITSLNSPTHCSTTDSGNVNGSCSSDELENEHVYSTLDSPLQSPNDLELIRGLGNPHSEPHQDPPSPAPPKRTMYFV